MVLDRLHHGLHTGLGLQRPRLRIIDASSFYSRCAGLLPDSELQGAPRREQASISIGILMVAIVIASFYAAKPYSNEEGLSYYHIPKPGSGSKPVFPESRALKRKTFTGLRVLEYGVFRK